MSYNDGISKNTTNLSVDQVFQKFNFNLMCSDGTASFVKSQTMLKKNPNMDFLKIGNIKSYVNATNDFVVYHVSEKVGHGVYSTTNIKKFSHVIDYTGKDFGHLKNVLRLLQAKKVQMIILVQTHHIFHMADVATYWGYKIYT